MTALSQLRCPRKPPVILIEFVVDAGVRNLNLVVDVWKLGIVGDSCLISARSRSGSALERHRGLSGLCVSVQNQARREDFASRAFDPPGFFEVAGKFGYRARLHGALLARGKVLVQREFPSLVRQLLTMLGERDNSMRWGRSQRPYCGPEPYRP